MLCLTGQAPARLRRLSRCGGTTTSQNAGKPIASSIDRHTISQPPYLALSGLCNRASPRFDLPISFLRGSDSAPVPSPSRERDLTRPGPLALSAPSLSLIPHFPLPFATQEDPLTNNSQRERLELTVPSRGFLIGGLVGPCIGLNGALLVGSFALPLSALACFDLLTLVPHSNTLTLYSS